MNQVLLVKNDKPITMEDAWKGDLNKFLTYRLRVCRDCGDTFNIEQQGIFYRCGCYYEEN